MQIVFWLLGGLGKLLRRALGVIRDYPWQTAVIVLAGALVILMRQWGIDHRDLTDQLADANGTIAEERLAHEQTVENIMKGREAARALDEQNAARVAAEAAAINERTIRDLETRTRTYADRADRLRARLAALEAGDGGGGNAAVPGDPDATCRAFGAADCEDLATRMSDGQSSIDKLIALQAWATGLTAINVNGQR
jgi:hypothetical protein